MKFDIRKDLKELRFDLIFFCNVRKCIYEKSFILRFHSEKEISNFSAFSINHQNTFFYIEKEKFYEPKKIRIKGKKLIIDDIFFLLRGWKVILDGGGNNFELVNS